MIFLLSLLLSVRLPAQTHFSQKNDAYTAFQNISTKDGLSSNLVLNILQDPYNLMWMATDNGLTRYGGSVFTVYRHHPNDRFSLLDNHIRLFSCAGVKPQLAPVKAPVKQNEFVVSGNLKTFLANHPNFSVVLRTPDRAGDITVAQREQDNIICNEIEITALSMNLPYYQDAYKIKATGEQRQLRDANGNVMRVLSASYTEGK